MTDKTDIAALLDMRDLAERIKAAMASCVESFCMEVADSIENEIGRELTEQEHQQISETASGLLVAQDQIEEERQRIAGLEDALLDARRREKSAERESLALKAELAALRGEQEPVEISDAMALAFHSATTDSAIGNDDLEEIKAGLKAVQYIFTRQPKPVVVLSDCTFESVSHMAHWYTEGECVAFVSGVEHAKKQMLAAGIVVKDGE